MANPYFSQIPNFQYVDRTPGERTISSFKTVKNLFKRAKLREDIFEDLSFFTKYQVQGEERPDNVAEKYYNDPTLDWVILLANNITNIQTEWPMSQQSYYNFLLDKYKTEEKLSEVHHYECTGVKDKSGAIIVKEGVHVAVGFAVTYFDPVLRSKVNATNLTTAITNLEYENNIQDEKRNIYVLKPEYLSVVLDDIEYIMEYKKGSTQYLSETLKRAENIRLYS